MRYISTLVLILILMLTNSLYSQVTTQWSSVYNGAVNDTDIVTSMEIDKSGNVYVTGFSKGSLSGKDVATIKYNSAGQQIWASRYNNKEVNGDDAASAIAVDAFGNVYVTGYSYGINTYKDFITLKYSQTGEMLWASRYNGKGNDDDVATALALDGLGNIIVTGFSVGLATSEDYLTIKYSSSGDLLWTSVYNNSEMDDIDIATSVGLDASGSIYVTGYSIGKGSSEDYATVKYSTAGVENWVQRFNGTGNSYDITTAMTVLSSGGVCVTGYSVGESTGENFLTIRYDAEGNILWMNSYDGGSGDYDIATAISSDDASNIFVTGYSYDAVTSEDYATIKYSPDGTQSWVSRYDGPSGESDIPSSLESDNNGGVYVTGYTYNPVTLEDYATIKYNSDGDQEWAEIYNGINNGSDLSAYLEVDSFGNIYVSGNSFDGSNGPDYVTIKYSQTVGINPASNIIPDKISLKQNYPNPFNPSTKINYVLRIANYVSLKVFDILGNEVRTLVNQKQDAGSYLVDFEGSGLSSGIYFYTLKTDGFSETKRMTLIK